MFSVAGLYSYMFKQSPYMFSLNRTSMKQTLSIVGVGSGKQEIVWIILIALGPVHGCSRDSRSPEQRLPNIAGTPKWIHNIKINSQNIRSRS